MHKCSIYVESGDPAGNLRLRAKRRRFAPRANGSDFFCKITKQKGTEQIRAFYFGDPTVNYPNTLIVLKKGFCFVLQLFCQNENFSQ